jgi:3-oxoadipate enol-lactonase
MPFARAGDGTRLFYEHLHPEDRPNAATALLVGPLGLSSRLYGFANAFALDAGYAVLTFDNRGCGRSEVPRRPWSVATMARDAIAVLNAANVARAHVCGPSLGGFIAQTLAARFPERVGALVLSSTTAGWPRVRLLPWRHSVAALLRVLGPRPSPTSSEQATRALIALMVSPEFAAATAVGSPTWNVVANLAEETRSLRGAAGQLLAGATYSGWKLLPLIEAPTQVQHGTADRVIPVRAARELAGRLPRAELHVFEEAGHALIIERSDEVAQATLAFLRRHEHLLESGHSGRDDGNC